MCVCVCVCGVKLGSKLMCNLLNFILRCSMLSLFLLLYAPWAVKLLLIGMALTNFYYYYYNSGVMV